MEMSNWQGAGAICLNAEEKVLLVRQGPPDEEKKWSVPSAGLEQGESPEQTCSRECLEATGVEVEPVKEIGLRNGLYEDGAVSFKLHYFLVKQVGGEIVVAENDPWIAEVAWKTVEEMEKLDLAYPDEVEWVRRCLV